MTTVAVDDATISRGGNTILSRVSVSAYPGELLCIVGPNGAGKSTLLSALSGDVVPDRGRVRIDDESIAAINAERLATLRAVMLQQHRVAFGFTAREVIEMGCARRGDVPQYDIEVVIDRLVLRPLLDRPFRVLSGGEQARVALARILLQETPVLLLDEPTAALDLRHQELVMTIARQQADAGATVVVVVHDLNLAGAYADRVALVADGGIVADGTPGDVFDADRLSAAYHVPIIVTAHPTRDCPLVLTDPLRATLPMSSSVSTGAQAVGQQAW